MKLCSACFLGVRCLWNRASRPNKKILELSKKEILIPICPEQLGGLSTPREPCKIVGNKVITRSGKDVTDNYNRGAEEALRIAKFYGITEAILKQGSPSCGCATTEPLKRGEGVTVKLFRQNGIKVISQGQIK
jgi:uncharacterized protein YbbK (DUF523 family)